MRRERGIRRNLIAGGAILILAGATSAAPLAGQAPRLDSLPPQVRQLSLDEALRLALPASEAVAIAQAAVSRTRGLERQARSEFYPQLTGTASYTRTLKSQFERASSGPPDTTVRNSCSRFSADPVQPDASRLDSLESAVECLSRLNPFAAFGDLPFGQRNQYRLGLSASQILFAGGRVRAQARAASAGVRAAEIGLTAQQAQLTLDVTQSYYDAALAERLLAIARGTLALADTTFRQTQVAQDVGAQPEFDVLRARVNRDNQRTTVIQREADRELAYLRLKQLLSLPLELALRLTTVVEDSTLPAVPALDSLLTREPDTTTEARAAVHQARAVAEADAERVKVARAERWPTVTLSSDFAELGYPSDLIPSGKDFVTDWTVGVTIRMPLFTGGRIGGSVSVAEANLVESELRLAQTRKRAAVDSRNALERLRAAIAAWNASQGTVAQAERAYAIAEIRFQQGISSQTELADSRLLLEQARAIRATAARDLQVSRIRVALLPDLPLSP